MGSDKRDIRLAIAFMVVIILSYVLWFTINLYRYETLEDKQCWGGETQTPERCVGGKPDWITN